MLFTLCHTWNSPSDITGILPLRSSPINIYSTTSYSYSPDKDDRKVKHHSLKPHTIQPVTDHEEDPVQGSGTGRMKRQFDFSSEKHILLHLAETSQEAILPCPTVGCAGEAQVHAALMDVYTIWQSVTRA